LKLKVLPLIAVLVSFVCISFLGYRGVQWWKKHQARKALSLYFQRNSPVTKRIPQDAFFYANFYDLKRVHDQLNNTSLYEVFAHWLDTGMSENEKANPLLGGMLEKTILNIVGDEFAIALMPQKDTQFDFLAVARIAPGSDFLLNLALSNAKNIEKIDTEQRIFYRIRTKDVRFPSIVIHVQENFAYASNNFQRLKQAYSGEGKGPEFLTNSEIVGIPEDTILFLQTKNPEFRGLLSGTGRDYRFLISDAPSVRGTAPNIQKTSTDVVRIQTNAAALIGQPTGTYLLQSKEGVPVSALLLGFSTTQESTEFEQKILTRMGPDPPEIFKKDGIECARETSGRSEEFVCRNGISLLLAQGQFALSNATFQNDPPSGKTPIVFKIDFEKNTIRDYQTLVQNKDWSRFQKASPFYFLSCVKQVDGVIDQTNREIDIELE
jgi:hypothetical protein